MIRRAAVAVAVAACAHRDPLDRVSGTESWRPDPVASEQDVGDDVFVRDARARWEEARGLWERERDRNERVRAFLLDRRAALRVRPARPRPPPPPPRRRVPPAPAEDDEAPEDNPVRSKLRRQLEGDD